MKVGAHVVVESKMLPMTTTTRARTEINSSALAGDRSAKDAQSEGEAVVNCVARVSVVS